MIFLLIYLNSVLKSIPVSSIQQEGTTPPSPSPLEAVSLPAIASELGLEGVEENGFINIVTVDVAEYAKVHFEKSVKKTLTIPAWLNRLAMEQNINFSQVLQDALKAKLNIR